MPTHSEATRELGLDLVKSRRADALESAAIMADIASERRAYVFSATIQRPEGTDDVDGRSYFFPTASPTMTERDVAFRVSMRFGVDADSLAVTFVRRIYTVALETK